MRSVTRFGLLGAAGAAFAVAVAGGPAAAAPISCSDVTNVSQFAGAADGCTSGDKLYKYVDRDTTDLPGSTIISFTEDNFGATHVVVQYLNFPSGQVGPYDAFLYYSIAVTNPNMAITGVTVSATVGSPTGPAVTVTKEIYDSLSVSPLTLEGIITSINGSESSVPVVGEDFLLIREFISVSAGNRLVSITNSFDQTEVPPFINVPEPMGLALVGIGLLALGLARHRRSR